MVTIYEDTRTNIRYALNPFLTQGSKVNLVPITVKGPEKFVSPSTIKRWYSKCAQVDHVVAVEAFTGMHLGYFVATITADGHLSVWTKNNKNLIFDQISDTQVNPNNPKFANRLGMVL